mgnify:CR=1 FL=1
MSSSPFSAWPFSMPSRQPASYMPQAYATAGAPAPTYPTYMPTMATNMPSYAPQTAAPAQTSPFSNWVFSVPPRQPQAPTYARQAQTYLPTIPTYNPATVASASAYAGTGIGLGNPYSMMNSMYPSTSSYMPPASPYAAPYASASASASSSSGGLNQLLQLLLPLLLSQLGGGNQGGYGNQQYPQGGGVDRPHDNHRHNDTDYNHQTTTRHNHNNNDDNDKNIDNNGRVKSTVNNFIIEPDDVNIAGINDGVQINRDADTIAEKPKREFAATAKDEKGNVGRLLAPGTKGADGKYKGKEFPPGAYGSTSGHHQHVYTVDPETQKVDVLQSPLTLDLNGDGKINTTAQNRSDIDIDADGQKDNISQIKDDGMLFIDPNKTGKITSGTQLLGDHTLGRKFDNGFEALKTVAKEVLGDAAIADGKLDATEIKQLEAKLGLGIEINGKMKKLADAGISELKLDFADANIEDAFGNQVRQISTAKKDGQDVQLADIWFLKQ